MRVVVSGSKAPRFTMTPRHEMQRLSGLAPGLTRAQAATLTAVSTGVRGLGATFPPVATGAYALLLGLFLGSLGGRR